MKIEFLSKFNQDLNKVHLKSVKDSLIKLIQTVEDAKIISEIRVGDYRIGVYIYGHTIEFARVLNRRDIYKYFP